MRGWLAGVVGCVCAAAAAASPGVDEAHALMLQGQFEQALAQLDRYLAAAPQDAEARFTRGLVLVRLNRNDDAAKVFTELTRDFPQLPEPYNNLAVIYAQQGEYDKARKALEDALATHPSYPVAHENLGDIYAALSAAAYNRALTLDPANASVRAKLKVVNQLDRLGDSATIAAAPALPVPAPKAAAPAVPAAGPDREAIEQVVRSWAAAWSAQDADRYLSFYAPDFTPERGASRAAWEDQRRLRIATPRQIEVQVSGVQVAQDGERAQVIFRQDYRSDAMNDRSTKVLDMARHQGQWRILREYTR